MPRGAIDFDIVRKIGLGLPDVEESTDGAPCLKFRGKLLTFLPTNKSAEPGSLAVSIGMDERAELIAADPDTYYVTSHYAGYPRVLVRMSRIDTEALRDLLRMACTFLASKSPAPKRTPRKC